MREQQQQQKRQQRQQRQGAEKKPKIRYYQAMNDQADQSRSGYGTRRAPLPGRGRVERRPSAEMSLLCDDRDSDDTRDHKSTRRSTLLHVTGFIIVTEFCERLAYYGFAGESSWTSLQAMCVACNVLRVTFHVLCVRQLFFVELSPLIIYITI